MLQKSPRAMSNAVRMKNFGQFPSTSQECPGATFNIFDLGANVSLERACFCDPCSKVGVIQLERQLRKHFICVVRFFVAQ